MALTTAEEVARGCHMTPVHLSRVFRRFGRTTPYHALMRLKMNRATIAVTGAAARSTAAQTALAARGIRLTNPIVITEAEYDAGWEADDDNQVVFVLPSATRQSGLNLLETAKMLMACVPNGI